jgi:hypothetical protein
MIPVYVTVGIGHWTAYAEVELIACPHVGDSIEVRGIDVNCEHVHITAKKVYVREVIKFQSEDALKEYTDAGWKR